MLLLRRLLPIKLLLLPRRRRQARQVRMLMPLLLLRLLPIKLLLLTR